MDIVKKKVIYAIVHGNNVPLKKEKPKLSSINFIFFYAHRLCKPTIAVIKDISADGKQGNTNIIKKIPGR
jgi:hypothetical protein